MPAKGPIVQMRLHPPITSPVFVSEGKSGRPFVYRAASPGSALWAIPCSARASFAATFGDHPLWGIQSRSGVGRRTPLLETGYLDLVHF